MGSRKFLVSSEKEFKEEQRRLQQEQVYLCKAK
jgi:hypothetical protein